MMVGDLVLFDVPMDFLLVITVEAERIKDLSWRQVGHMRDHYFWGKAHAPVLYNRPHRCAGAFNNRLSPQYAIIPDDIQMFCSANGHR